ncbi:cyclin G isoform X1 [Nylanderia fulva]|uniref:cyclin G isoform X1 n=1 Tax=Nylanderia fulva TaxID=613905 RepID=UPI0010FAD415|nr:cyclin G isoform X1 [Nylanderia fulva]XP_029178867.1 cyclin G isoform X1 [Nylanderia fulva]
MSHTAGMDTSGLPVPDAIPSLEQLREDLVLNLVQEVKFQPNLDELPITIQDNEISIAARDKSAYILRCLKVMYDLPSDVFFMAINLMDCFLTRMKAKQKYMACISVSAFYTAAQQMQPLNADHVVSISQCRCTADDLRRMSDVIKNKLERAPDTRPITALTFIRLFNNMFHAVARQLHHDNLYASIINESELILRLEMVACDGNCASLRPSEVALVVLCSYLDAAVNRLMNANTDTTVNNLSRNASIPLTYQRLRNELMQFAAVLRKKCNISEESFRSTHGAVSAILSKYNAQEQTNKTHKQKLIWKVSPRTAVILRPSQNFTSVLPVIAEHVPSVPSPNKISRKSRKYRRRGNKRC